MILNSRYSKNILGQDFFLGDLHGSLTNLKKLLYKVKFNKHKDRVFSVGDLIDRGTHSYECLSLLDEPWFNSILGNHEQFLLNVERDDSYKAAVWFKNGGDWWLKISNEQRLRVRELIVSKVPLTMSIETSAGLIGLVHAEYPFESWPVTSVNEEDIHKMLWGRSEIEENKHSNISYVDYVVSGHTPLSSPKLRGKRIFIDTGEGYQPSEKIPNPKLTACEFTEKTLTFHCVTNTSYSTNKVNLALKDSQN
jgi:serine/threonine protein phosphatase 1